QTSTLPSPDDLGGASGGPDYYARVRALLRDRCGLHDAAVSAVGPEILEATAYELAAGRTEKNLLANGLCTDSRIDPAASSYVGISLGGRVSLADHDDVGLGGVRVKVVAREIGRVICESLTVSSGGYG